MKVRAKLPVNGSDMAGVGYYDLRLFKGGEEFELSDLRHFSEKWMEKVEEISVGAEPVEDATDEEESPRKKKR